MSTDERPILAYIDRPPSVEAMMRPYMIKKALNNDRKFDIFHPSAWGSCLRKIAYQYYNEKSKFLEREPSGVDVKSERIFDNGHATHHRWQTYLDCAGILRGHWKCQNPLCSATYGEADPLGIKNPSREQGWQCQCGSKETLGYLELPVKSEAIYNFEGHVDAVVDVAGTEWARQGRHDVFIVDLKTMKDELFCTLTAPKQEHVVQTNIYMWILGLQGAVVLYENKDNQCIKEMFIPRDEALIERIKTQALWMMQLLRKNKLPFRPNGFARSKYPCRFCEFVDHCYG